MTTLAAATTTSSRSYGLASQLSYPNTTPAMCSSQLSLLPSTEWEIIKPTWDVVSNLAEWCSSRSTMWLCWCLTAMWSGEYPSRINALTSAEKFNNNSAVSTSPSRDDICSAVWPSCQPITCCCCRNTTVMALVIHADDIICPVVWLSCPAL